MDTNIGSSIFQATSVNIDNACQNLEEEEELEDLKRRQEEIQSLLTKAMDDFNYDDQSTVNTSVNESMEYAQQYKEAGLENQLQVMYQIRVKELESLQAKMEEKELQLTDMKAQMMQSLMLSEAENDKLRNSLKNSQELLVEKCNVIEQLTDEKQRILYDCEGFKQVLSKLEVDKAATDYNNQELREQVAILENGRAANPLNEAMLQENHRMEVTKLQHNLDAAFLKNERLEKDNLTLAEKLNTVITEKTDMLATKSDVINKLMENLDQAQHHNGELLTNMTHLTSENERFRMQIQELEANVQTLKGFTDKTEIIKILQKELEKSKNLTTKQSAEFERLRQEYADLMKENKSKTAKILLLEEDIERKPNLESHSMQTSAIVENIAVSENLKDELESYKKQNAKQNEFLITLQQQNITFQEDILNLNKKLELSAQRDSLTAALQEKAIRLEEIILNNKKPIYESKSTNTEPPVESSITTMSACKNYEDTKDQDASAMIDVYRTKYETELIEKEIELREQLRVEFEKQYTLSKAIPKTCDNCTKLSKDIAENEQLIEQLKIQVADNVRAKQREGDEYVCKLCQEMSMNLMQNLEIISNQENELEQHRINQEKDKIAIVQMLEVWKIRFEDVERRNEDLRQHSEALTLAFNKAKQQLAFYQRSEEVLLQTMQKKVKKIVSHWSSETLHQVRMHNQYIRTARAKVEEICRQTDGRVKVIERDFDKAHLQLKRSVSTQIIKKSEL